MSRFLLRKCGSGQDAGASPGSERRVGFLDELRLTGALDDDERPLVVRCSDVRLTGRLAREGRDFDERDLDGASSGGGFDERRGEAAAGRVGVSQ